MRAALARDQSAPRRLIDDKIAFEDVDGRTPLMVAVINDDTDAIGQLLEAGADVNSQDKNGFSALHFAAQENRQAAAKLLLAANASVDLKATYGNSPLWRAVFSSRGGGELIHLLLSYSAARDLRNNSGVSPLDLANTIGNYDVARFFR